MLILTTNKNIFMGQSENDKYTLVQNVLKFLHIANKGLSVICFRRQEKR